MRKIFLSVLSWFPLILMAQDLTGTWTAKTPGNIAYTVPSKIIVEIQQTSSGLLTGVSHYFYPGNYYEHYHLTGKVDSKTKQVLFKEDSLINYRMQPGMVLISGDFKMTLQVQADTLRMSGQWIPESPSNPPMFYTMQKPNLTKKDSGKVVKKNVTVVTDRLDKVMKVLELEKKEADSITIDVYDNGEIDGDTVTVLLNNQVVVNRQKITAKPITFKTSLSKENPIQQIRMIANNLGTIPPNTALMIITTKTNRYTVSLSSDLKTNGVLELFLKE